MNKCNTVTKIELQSKSLGSSVGEPINYKQETQSPFENLESDKR